MTSLGTKLNHSLMKAVLIGGLTAAGTFVLSPGTALNPVALGAYHIEAVVPLVAATGLILAGSSVATDFILPMIQKEVSAGNPELLKMENVVLSPIVIGGVSFALLSLLSPETKISFLPEAPALGTHVYTLLSPIAPATPMKWSVATVPSSISLQRERERVALKLRQTAKRHLPQVPVQATMTNEPILTPQTALTQVQIPDEARNIIFAALTPASSLIVSDLGLGSETGKGTEFIVQAK